MKYSSGANRFNTARLIAGRELKSTVYSLGIYVVMGISFVVAAFLLRNYLYSISENGLLVLPSPLNYPLYISVAISATYLALLSALSISRERDQGTLEVLFYGPVDAWGYITGKYIEQMIAFLIIAAFNLVYFYIASSITNLGMSSSFVLILVMSVFMASCMVAFGIFISSLTKKVRNSIILFTGLVVVFLAFDLVYQILMGLSGEELSTTLVYARIAAEWLNKVFEWISPFAYLKRGMNAVTIQSSLLYGRSILWSLIYTAVLLWLSVALFNRKGVKK